MRTFGEPSASTVASAMASGLTDSERLASANKAPNSRSGASASVKSPAVNQPGCSIDFVSDIRWGTPLLPCNDQDANRYPLYRGSVRFRLSRLPRRLAVAIAAVSAISAGGCSLPLDSMFEKND